MSLTSLVGRERDLEELSELIGDHRLVTLTGVGGSGKTRLAAELALRVDWQQADSVAWVEFAVCFDPVLVPQQIASALKLRDTNEERTLDAIVDTIRGRDFLLVFDDCEHLIAAVAEVARKLLCASESLRIVATSREPLGVAGERVWPVPPIAPGEAVKLFADRAAAADPSFDVTPANRPFIGEICERLDGIPLAIELAAARVRVLTPEQIAAKLEDRFTLLTGGVRTAIPRHRTLRAAIDWSFALLSDAEQALMARLSIFAGTFTLDAAETVCSADLDLLNGLVDKSLVVTTRCHGVIRYHLLETVRQYAAERLAAIGGIEDLRRRHALACLAMVREAVVDPMSDITARLDSLDPEHCNVRTALTWAIEHEPDTIALPLAATFRWYWYYRILWSEGLRWLSRVLERSSAAASRDRAAAFAGAGVFATYLGDIESGRRWLEEAETMWKGIGDRRERAITLSAYAQLLANAGELDRAGAMAEESVALARERGTVWDLAYCLVNALGFVAQRQGELERADRAFEEAEQIFVSIRHPLGLPFVLNARAMVALRRGDTVAAARFARAALVEGRAARELWFCARSLRVLAATSAGDPRRAARLIAASDTMLRTIGARPLMHEKVECDRLVESLRDRLGSEELENELTAGASLSFDDACETALATELAVSDTTTLHVRDLGPLQITLGDKPLTMEARASNRARELLAFLLVRPNGATREEVGVAFWPDATTEQVKNSFHVTLHRLRKLLGSPEGIVTDGGRYSIAMPRIVDSVRFESSVTAALREGANDIAPLESALALYTGDYLQGEDAGEWCLPIRARLRQLFVRGLFALGRAHESRGRYADATDAYERVLSRDPFHEAAARQLMICNARLGARSESILVYRQLEQRLRDDLQATPEPETRTLYQRLRQNEGI